MCMSMLPEGKMRAGERAAVLTRSDREKGLNVKQQVIVCLSALLIAVDVLCMHAISPSLLTHANPREWDLM